MTLDRTGKPCSGSVTRQAALRAAGMVKLELDSCAWILNEALPSTTEALQEQGTMIKVARSNLRRSVFQLEDIEPDDIIVTGYLQKRRDMNHQLYQRMAKINERLATFGRGPMMILGTTYASSNKDQSSLSNYTITSPSSPKQPIADGRPEIPISWRHEPPLGGTQPTCASPTQHQTEYKYDNIQNYQPPIEAAPCDTFLKIAPANEDNKLPAPPDGLSTACKSVIMPATDTSVLQTAVYSSHDLDVYYGICENKEPPDTKIDSLTNETRPLVNNVKELKCRYCNKVGHNISHCYQFSLLNRLDKHVFMRLEARCFKCLETEHFSFECASMMKCAVEGCDKLHPPALHHELGPLPPPPWDQLASAPETVPAAETAASAHILRTQVGGRVIGSDHILGNKTVPTDQRLDGDPGNCIRVPAVLDKQSEATIPADRVLDLFGLPFPPIANDLIPTDAENATRSVGRPASGLNVSGALSQPPTSPYNVPTVEELDYSRDGVATPEIGTLHRHDAPYPSELSPCDPSPPVSLFIGTSTERVLGTHVPLSDVYPPRHQNPLGGAPVGQSHDLLAPIALVKPLPVPHTPPNFNFGVENMSSPPNSPPSPPNPPYSPLQLVSHALPSISNSVSSTPNPLSSPLNPQSSPTTPRSFPPTLTSLISHPQSSKANSPLFSIKSSCFPFKFLLPLAKSTLLSFKSLLPFAKSTLLSFKFLLSVVKSLLSLAKSLGFPFKSPGLFPKFPFVPLQPPVPPSTSPIASVQSPVLLPKSQSPPPNPQSSQAKFPLFHSGGLPPDIHRS